MSNLIFTACWLPSEELVQASGAKKIAYCFESANARQARAKATMDFVVQYPEADDEQYEMFIYQDDVGIPRPPRGCWSEEFLYENEWNSELGYPVAIPEAKENNLIDFMKIPANQRLAVLVKYGMQEITTDLLPDAIELLQDDASTFEGHIVEALHREGSISAMFVERQLELISSIKETQPKTKKWPEILSYVKGWLKALKADRKEGSTAANEEQKTPRPKRSYSHTHQTLDQEIAVAFWSGDVDPGNVSGEILRWAKKEVMEKDREDWRRFSMSMRTQPGVLKYDLLTVRDVVQDRPTDIHKSPVDLNNYIGNFLTTKGVFENADEQDSPSTSNDMGAQTPSCAGMVSEHANSQPTEETPPVERQGPFYYRTAAGDKIGRANKLPKLQEVLAQGCVEISQEEYQARKTGTYNDPVNQKQGSETSGEVGKQLADGRGEYVEGISKKNDPKWVHTEQAASNEVEKPDNHADTEQPVVDFQSVGASLEKDLQEKPEHAQDNLKIWRSVMRTDPRFTKQMTGTGFEGTSINAEYMIMRATEIFGPIGSRWGFEILEDRMIPGAPFSEPVYEDKKFIGNRMLRDGDGTLIFEQNHSLKIRFWYQTETDEGSVHAYGATPYMFKTKHGIKCDGEAQKKSLTDALKKALSLLGFSADVWLGLYDLPEYQAENSTEFAIKNASDKAEDVTRLRNELDEKLTRVANTIENAVSTNEAKKVFDTLAREVEVHRKAADAKGDLEHAKYLSGRLRRLSQIKDQRIQKLTENQEQSA